MIFTERTIRVTNGTSQINSPVVLYKGDKNIKIRFKIVDCPYTYSKNVDNIIEVSEASYAQLVIKTPNDGLPIFSDIVETESGYVTFTITGEMIDEAKEVGKYSFQVRLLDDEQFSRITIPEVVDGIDVRDPIAIEGVSSTNEVDIATVGYALTTAGTVEDTFDTQGNYNKTTWRTNDRITAAKLNKIEAAIDGVNKKVASGGTGSNINDTTASATTTYSSNKIESIKEDLNSQIEAIGGGTTGTSKYEPEELDIPKVFFNGGKPTTKDEVYATIEYVSASEHFKGHVAIKCQGNTSMAYPKKNYTIKMYKDEARTTKLKKDFKGWGEQNKFCLKANYIDHSHARNIVSAKLWNEVVASRSNYQELPELLRTSPMNGAIDGFPIKVYYNNTYEGIYTWNIPKDKWTFNMDDALDNHCVLCGEEYVSGCFRSANANLWSDEIHDVMPESIKTSFNNFISFVMNSSDDEFKANLSNYVYVDSLIDYYIFQYVICGLDSMGKNQLFATYDGTKWIATSYDMDSTFGLYWNGQSFVSAIYRMQEDYESGKNTANNYNGEGNLLYVRLERLFIEAIKTRYVELRSSILSYANIVDKYERFMDVIGKDLYAEDLTIYPEIPSGATNNIQQIRNYTRDRLVYVDAQIEALTPTVPCTGITLSANNLSFTTTDTQTLTATVEPTNTSDVVTWSVSPTGVVTVDNGVVTPVTNGNCTITATCGSQSATCNVTVSGIVNSYTVTNVLTDCTNSNSANRVDEGSSYSATITANDGYALEQVTVTMGGSDISSSAVSDGVITISNVTGNIIITAIATGDNSPVYSLAAPATFNGTSDYIDTGVQLYDQIKDFAVFVDFNGVSGEKKASTVLHSMLEGNGFPGFQIDVNPTSGIDNVYRSQTNTTLYENIDDTQQRYVFINDTNSKTLVVYCKNNSKDKEKISLSYSNQTFSQNATLGCYQDIKLNKGRFFTGTINQCKIWFRKLTDDEINNLLS